MGSGFRVSVLPLLVLQLPGCSGANFSPPLVTRGLTISYPPNVLGDLPTDSVGSKHSLQVKVTSSGGLPVRGVAIFWDGGAFPSPVLPEVDSTDIDGLSTSVWQLRLLPGRQSVRAYLPGAADSPVEYRILAVPKPPHPPPPPSLKQPADSS